MFEDAPNPSSGSRSDPGASAELAVCTRRLSKHYRHPWTLKVTQGLSDLDLEIHRGEVFGYLGPNGSGKTTTIKLLTGLLRPTSGQGWMMGSPIGTERSRHRIGFLPEQPYFYDSLNGVEYLEFVGRLSGLGGQDAHQRATQWLGRVGLGERQRLQLRKYSKGMLQRLGLAAALIHGPALLILDEPMSGLDPFGRRDVRELILEQREQGVTVMLSSHILPDVEMLCDRVGVLLGGRLKRTATVNDLVASQQHKVEIRCVGAPLVEVPARWRERVARFELPEGTTFLVDDERDLNEVLAWLVGAGIAVRAVTPQRASLEDFFLSVVESTVDGPGGRRMA